MARPRNRRLWDAWHERFERFRAGGGSVAEFCRGEGVSQASFYQWRRKLRAEEARQARPTQAFLPILVRPERPGRGEPADRAVMIRLLNGAIVRMSGDDPGVVRLVIRTVAELEGGGGVDESLSMSFDGGRP